MAKEQMNRLWELIGLRYKFVEVVEHNRKVVMKRYSMEALQKNMESILYSLYLQLQPNEKCTQNTISILKKYQKKVNFRNKDVEILTYPNQLLQVLLNFINNAKDAINEKNPTKGLIKIILKEEKESVIIGICDNGGGIDSSIKDTIAEPYVSSKSKNGTGLGLYMSMIIAKKHLDGKIYWTSDKLGSCFYIALSKSLSQERDINAES